MYHVDLMAMFFVWMNLIRQVETSNHAECIGESSPNGLAMTIGNPLEMGVSIGKSPINSVFSIAMFDYRRVLAPFYGRIMAV